MKFLLIAAAVLAIAVATPAQHRRPEPIGVNPAIVDEFHPIAIGPTYVEESVIPEPANVGLSSSPLVQIIVNVQANSPVIEEGKPRPEPIPDPSIIPNPEIEADPVIVVPMPEIETDPVNVVPMPETPAIIPEPVINLPEILN